jgi:cytochrome c biogenesis protein CcmG/thiol:disulfide interchange protein DsbE
MDVATADVSRETEASEVAARMRRRWARGLLLASGLVVLSLAWLGLLAMRPPPSITGSPAPPFDLESLRSDGRISSHDLAGRVAVINAFASWCGPCREEAPVLRRAYESADPAHVAFLGVAHTDRREDAIRFLDDFDLEFPAALDDGSFGRDFGVRGLPMTFVLDAAGNVIATQFGPISEPRLTALIEDALSRSATAP